ncbi:hypothetical protein VTO73DRAFT_8295 [Trametes versicolor]
MPGIRQRHLEETTHPQLTAERERQQRFAAECSGRGHSAGYLRTHPSSRTYVNASSPAHRSPPARHAPGMPCDALLPFNIYPHHQTRERPHRATDGPSDDAPSRHHSAVFLRIGYRHPCRLTNAQGFVAAWLRWGPSGPSHHIGSHQLLKNTRVSVVYPAHLHPDRQTRRAECDSPPHLPTARSQSSFSRDRARAEHRICDRYRRQPISERSPAPPSCALSLHSATHAHGRSVLREAAAPASKRRQARFVGSPSYSARETRLPRRSFVASSVEVRGPLGIGGCARNPIGNPAASRLQNIADSLEVPEALGKPVACVACWQDSQSMCQMPPDRRDPPRRVRERASGQMIQPVPGGARAANSALS